MNEILGHSEQLPDEILLYLFENSVRLHINIPSKDKFHIKSFSYFTSQILSLHLSTFSSDLDLSKIFNLRFLHPEKPTRSQLNLIREDILPNLVYLSVYPCWYNLHELPNHLTNIDHSSSFKYLCLLPGKKESFVFQLNVNI